MKRASFKKAGLVLIVFVVITLILSTVLTFAQAEFVLGDVTADGRVTSADARLVLRHSAKLETLTKTALKAADFNGDGKVDAADARAILRKSVNLDDIQYTTTEIQSTTWATPPVEPSTQPTTEATQPVQPSTQPTTIQTTQEETQTTEPTSTQLTGTGDWSRAYMTYYSSEEGGGENFDTAMISRILVWSGGSVIPNYSKGIDVGPDNIVTFHGFNILGTTNRRILPMGSVVEYRVAGRYFQGVVLDNNGDNMAGRSLVTMDHLFIKSREGEKFMDSLIEPWEYLPICEYRIIGKINISTGEVIPY